MRSFDVEISVCQRFVLGAASEREAELALDRLTVKDLWGLGLEVKHSEPQPTERSPTRVVDAHGEIVDAPPDPAPDTTEIEAPTLPPTWLVPGARVILSSPTCAGGGLERVVEHSPYLFRGCAWVVKLRGVVKAVPVDRLSRVEAQ